MTSRHYCITFFTKPTVRINDKIRYAIYGRETCPKTGKIHWQGYVELFNPTRVAGLKKLYNDKTIHLEKRAGTREQARDYCKKEAKFKEYGKWIKGQGHRSDLESVIESLQEGSKISEIMLAEPKVYCQYRNGLKEIAAHYVKEKTKEFRKVNVTLLTGPTQCGKTRHAMEHAQYKIQGNKMDWWQDYDLEEKILIDEYNNDVPITELLALLDGYQLRLNVKSSHTYANWNEVYITTNLKIDEIHQQAKPAHRAALFRRITKIINFWPEDICNEEAQG